MVPVDLTLIARMITYFGELFAVSSKNFEEIFAVNSRSDCEGPEIGCSAASERNSEILEIVLPSMVTTSSAVPENVDGKR
jgi:hypothetical protein